MSKPVKAAATKPGAVKAPVKFTIAELATNKPKPAAKAPVFTSATNPKSEPKPATKPDKSVDHHPSGAAPTGDMNGMMNAYMNSVQKFSGLAHLEGLNGIRRYLDFTTSNLKVAQSSMDVVEHESKPEKLSQAKRRERPAAVSSAVSSVTKIRSPPKPQAVSKEEALRRLGDSDDEQPLTKPTHKPKPKPAKPVDPVGPIPGIKPFVFPVTKLFSVTSDGKVCVKPNQRVVGLGEMRDNRIVAYGFKGKSDKGPYKTWTEYLAEAKETSVISASTKHCIQLTRDGQLEWIEGDHHHTFDAFGRKDKDDKTIKICFAKSDTLNAIVKMMTEYGNRMQTDDPFESDPEDNQPSRTADREEEDEEEEEEDEDPRDHDSNASSESEEEDEGEEEMGGLHEEPRKEEGKEEEEEEREEEEEDAEEGDAESVEEDLS